MELSGEGIGKQSTNLSKYTVCQTCQVHKEAMSQKGKEHGAGGYDLKQGVRAGLTEKVTRTKTWRR